MTPSPRSARITGPVPYTTAGGARRNIPLGPCLLENRDAQRVDIVWGRLGQSATALPLAEVQAARTNGHLVLL